MAWLNEAITPQRDRPRWPASERESFDVDARGGTVGTRLKLGVVSLWLQRATAMRRYLIFAASRYLAGQSCESPLTLETKVFG